MGNIGNKYRVHEVAKDFGLPTKQITEILTQYAQTPKNHMQVLEDRELSLIFEYLTQHNPVSGIQVIFAEGTKPAEKKAERLKDYLTYVLGGEKFQTVKCAVSFRKSQTVEIDEGFTAWAEKTGNDNLLRYKAPEANKVAIKALLTQGADIPCARLTQNTSITIK